MPKIHRHEAVVTFSGAFPLDMLRYDACYPADSESAILISESLDTETRRELAKRPGGFAGRTVKIARFGHADGFTFARWRSFGCDITASCTCCAEAPARRLAARR